MSEVIRDAREWLEDKSNWIARPEIWDSDLTLDKNLVEKLFEKGAVFVKVGLTDGIPTRADALFVTLPYDEHSKLEIMLVLAKIKGDAVRCDHLANGTDIVIVSWME